MRRQHAIGLVGRFASCFADGREAGLVEHTVETTVAQRGSGSRWEELALGPAEAADPWEDLIDHDQLRHDPMLARWSASSGLGARPARHSPARARSTGSSTRPQQLDLFADRTSAATMRANQLRLWFASFAYVLLDAPRRLGLRHTRRAAATCASIRLKLLKIGAQVRHGVRPIKIAMASACPYQSEDQSHLDALRQAGSNGDCRGRLAVSGAI